MPLTCVLSHQLIFPTDFGFQVLAIDPPTISTVHRVTLPTFNRSDKITSGDKKAPNGPDAKCDFLVTAVASSPRLNLLAVADSYKRVLIYQADTQLSVANECKTDRKVASFTFANNSETLLILDRTGDVFIWKNFIKSTDPPKLLLGHLSVILDMKLTQNDKYIITCDRDEKIRVSHFPNGYNIQTYCLGHKQFVSQVSSIEEEKLISASGDRTIRLWQMSTGKQLNSYNCKFPVKQILLLGEYIVVIFYSEKTCQLLKVVDQNILPEDEVKLTYNVLEMHLWNERKALFITDEPGKSCVIVQVEESKLEIDCSIDTSTCIDEESRNKLIKELAQDESQLKFMLKTIKSQT